MKLKTKLAIIIGIVFLVAILSVILSWPSNITTSVYNIAIALIIGSILSALAGKIIEKISSFIFGNKNFFKNMLVIEIKVFKFKFSISPLFILLTLWIVNLLFG